MTKSLMINASENCENEKELLCYRQASNATANLKCDGESKFMAVTQRHQKFKSF
jgi:hypothetical protein